MRLDTKSVDGLRGLAALHVACGHMLFFSREPNVDLVGGTSMGLFFIISGFVMILGYGQRKYKDNDGMICDWCCCCCDSLQCCATREQQQSEEEDGSISFPTKSFLCKRFARVAPMYYLTSLIAIPLWFMGPVKLVTFILTVALTFCFATSWVVVVLPLNGVLWTVSTMFFFYLCYPCLIPRLQKLKSADECRTLAFRMYWLQILICVVVLILFSGVDGGLAYWMWRAFPPNRLPVFVMGCCAGLVALRSEQDDAGSQQMRLPQQQLVEPQSDLARPLCFKHNDTVTPAIVFMSIVIMGTLFSILRLEVLSFLVRLLGEAILPILFYDWIIALSRSVATSSSSEGDTTTSLPPPVYSSVEKLFRSKPLQFLGHISMSFYVVHLLVLAYVGWIIRAASITHVEDTTDIGDDPAIPGWAIPIVFVISLFIGWIATEFVEIPAQRFLVRLFAGSTITTTLSTDRGDGRRAVEMEGGEVRGRQWHGQWESLGSGEGDEGAEGDEGSGGSSSSAAEPIPVTVSAVSSPMQQYGGVWCVAEKGERSPELDNYY
jgi:peptidoglycan/LPS O-acetylase OafA/YrhL